jgi:hypothetical protein
VSPLTPPIQPQPQVKEWIELYDKGVISLEELRYQLALATASAISSPTLDDSPATRGVQPQLGSRVVTADQLVDWAWTVMVRLPSLSRCRA